MSYSISKTREVCNAKELPFVPTENSCQCSGMDYNFLLYARKALPEANDLLMKCHAWIKQCKDETFAHGRITGRTQAEGQSLLEKLGE